jgi:hypothetical protein
MEGRREYFFENVLREDRYERCLHGKPSRVAEYRQGLSRASTGELRITLGEGRAVPPVYPRASEGTPSFTQIAILAKKYF